MSRCCLLSSVVVGVAALGGASSTSAAEVDPATLVDALQAVFGEHEGFRRGHANGICVKGSFTSTPEAAKLSSAEHLSSAGPWPVVGRFSMGGGDPAAPNNDKGNTRGLALHIDLGQGTMTDLVMISAPVFPARTPELFLELLQTVATKDGDKIEAFFKAHPEATRQKAWLTERPVPASYATVNYWGVHAFTLVDPSGAKQAVKWKLVPTGGEVGLTDDEAKAKAHDFYAPELEERLAKGPASFELNAILGEAGDPTSDPTAPWPEADRKSVKMGTVTIAALEHSATCDAGIFDPTNVTAGIEGPADDPIFLIRSPAYAVSFSRRSK